MSSLISAAEMKQRLVRYQELRPCTTAFIDTRTPGNQKENFTIIGPGVAESPDQHIHINIPHGFNVGAVRQQPHCVNSQHSHETAEVFVVQNSRWAFRWGEHGTDGEIIAGPGDVLSIPVRMFRGFENVGDEVGFMYALLGGDVPGRVTWTPGVFEKAKQYGLVLLENGQLVDTTVGEQIPDGVAVMPATSPEVAASMRRMNYEDMRKGWFTDADAAPQTSSVLAQIDGIEEMPIIGGANPGENIRAGKMAWPHGFHLRRLTMAAGSTVPAHSRQQEEVLYIYDGSMEIHWPGGRFTLHQGDVFTIPVHLQRRFENSSDTPAVAYVVHGGDEPGAPEFVSEIPARSPMDAALNQNNKKIVWNFWDRLAAADNSSLPAIAATALHEQVRCFGPDPIGEIQGRDAWVDRYWSRLLRSFPDLKRRTYLFCGGQSNGQADGDMAKDGKMWVSGTGHFAATFSGNYLGIPATGKPVEIRWGEFLRLENDLVVDYYFLLDLLDLMKQAGYEVLPPILAKDQHYRPPAADDGILLAAQDEQQTRREFERIHRFIYDSLNSFDQENLSSMGVADYFAAGVQWYGPGGIGSCHSLKEFEEFHQRPWLTAFPDRRNQDLDSLFAEGAYTAGSGWTGTRAIHSGPFKGVEGTGRPVRFNGMDWWKSDGDKFVENWVFVDMIHLFRQFGVDLFARLDEQIALAGTDKAS